MLRRRGLNPLSQYTFRGLDRLDAAVLGRIAGRYPGTVRRLVERMLGGKNENETAISAV